MKNKDLIELLEKSGMNVKFIKVNQEPSKYDYYICRNLDNWMSWKEKEDGNVDWTWVNHMTKTECKTVEEIIKTMKGEI